MDDVLRIVISPLLRGKDSIGAESGAGGVAGHDPEMIGGVRTQA
jgi:hypothetical protein